MTGLHPLLRDPDEAAWMTTELPSAEPEAAPLQSATWIQKQSGGGTIIFGQWRCEPGVFDVKDHPHLEYCRVLDGVLKAIDEDGTEHLLTEGMSFVIPKGYCARWQILEPFRKEVVVVAEKRLNPSDCGDGKLLRAPGGADSHLY